MIAMIFEYWLDEEYLNQYVDQATELRKHLPDLEGFISIERFRSESDPEKILALGFFEDEDAVQRWRNLPEHRQAQILGRKLFFTDYRLRMAEVKRDYSKERRQQVPIDSQRIHTEQLKEE